MGTMKESPAQPEFDEVAAVLVGEGAKRSQMMGTPTLVIGGKMFACLDGPSLAVKLGRETELHAEALDIPGAHVFNPGPGRSFYDWVSVPLDATDDWERYARAAPDYVASRPAKR